MLLYHVCFNQEVTEIVVHAFVTSKLDLYNILLCGIPNTSLCKLQKIQNSAARLIFMANKYDHITPLLKSLHWLPIKYRIQFKILLFTYKAVNKLAPKYICDLLAPYNPPRQLRSTSQLKLQEVRTRTKMGERAFSVSAPKLWNTLPMYIKTVDSLEMFKIRLKSYLFNMFAKAPMNSL